MAEEDVKKIYDGVKKTFLETTITTGNVIILAVQAMQLVERTPNLTGSDKKRIVIQVVKLIVDEFDLDSETKAAIHLVIDTTLPVSIDLIISASRGEFGLNSLKTKFAKLCCTP